VTVKPVIPLNVPHGTATNAETCIDFASEMVTHCLAHHESCFLGQDLGWIPSRLLNIDLLPGVQDLIRLIERDDVQTRDTTTGLRYLTLSHAWGSHIPLALMEANVGEMKRGINISDLPQCFQDAIYLTRRLGIRYLWIDSMW
jgi:Heterokaryon incompatibility protein (HET)